MRTVALVTQKGGSGKSTLSACLAVEMQARGEKVFLVDLDPQRSLATWARGRSDRHMAGAAMGSERLGEALATLRARGVTLTVIDTPASLTPATDAAVAAADLVILPCRPTPFDIWSCEATWRRIRGEGKDCAFVLNQCPNLQASRRVREAAAAIEGMGGLLTPMIVARPEYQDAIQRGLGPTELDPTGPAADEVRRLCDSIRRRMAADRSRRRRAA